MPCRDEPCDYGPPAEERHENDVKARLACALCTYMESEGIPIPDWAIGWWEKHKAWDIKRKAQEKEAADNEAKAKEAMSKLTPEELRVLKIHGHLFK